MRKSIGLTEIQGAEIDQERVMAFQRSAGILLHPTSLPGPDGVGDLGPQAYRWID